MAGLSAFGTTLKRGSGSPTVVYTAIAEVADLSGPEFSTETFDTSSHSSPNAIKEKNAGMIELGDLSFTINWFPQDATHQVLMEDLMSRAIIPWQIEWANTGGAKWNFDGIVTGFSPTAPIDDKLSADVTVTVTGNMVITDPV